MLRIGTDDISNVLLALRVRKPRHAERDEYNRLD